MHAAVRDGRTKLTFRFLYLPVDPPLSVFVFRNVCLAGAAVEGLPPAVDIIKVVLGKVGTLCGGAEHECELVRHTATRRVERLARFVATK